MKSIRLTSAGDGYYDIKLENGKFSFAEDGTQTAQHALTRILLFNGEWEFNTALGTRWYETIFDASKSRSEKEFELKRQILATPGVKKIHRFSWEMSGHTANISGAIQTDWGDEEFTDALELL